MDFDFDRITDRRGTNSLKYDYAKQRGKPEDLLPLWVADMDFPTAPCVREALERAVAHGIFGYSEPLAGYFDAVAGWFSERFGYTPEPEWSIRTPGVVYALAAAVRSLTEPGDGVLIQTPVYYPFYEVVRDNGRTLVESPLVRRDGKWTMDFEDLERKLPAVKLLLLCSPHNPVGRVWTRGELERLGALCERYGVVIVSDEIHCDFVWPGHRHTVFPTLDPALARRTVLCTSPSKSFNLAGLQISNVFIQDPELRRRFRAEVTRTGYSQPNALGLAACQAAYAGGGAWLGALNAYLWDNLRYFQDALADTPLTMELPEGTYLAWVDCAGLGLGAAELEDFMVQKAKLWLDGGALFGEAGARYQRFNVACPRETLAEAVKRLKAALR